MSNWCAFYLLSKSNTAMMNCRVHFLYSVFLLLMFANLLIGDRFHHFETLLNSGVATAVTFWYKVSIRYYSVHFIVFSDILS